MSRHALFEFGPTQNTTFLKNDDTGCITTERILLYGDSLTAGYPEFTPYAKALRLACASIGLELTIVGCGLCGLTAREMRNHLRDRGLKDTCRRGGVGLLKLLEDESADSGPFSLVLIMAGTNDILEAASDPEEIAKDIQSLHEACHSYGVGTVMLSVPDLKQGQLQREAWLEVNSRLKEWACDPTGRAVHFAESAELLPYNEKTLFDGAWEEDGIHFSEKGSQLFGTSLALQLVHWMRPGLAGQLEKKLFAEQVPECQPGKKPLAIACPKRVLVLGSSATIRAGAPPGQGWVEKFATAAEKHDYEVSNETLDNDDITLDDWQVHLCDLSEEQLKTYYVVMISPFKSIEQMILDCKTQPEMEDVAQHYVEGLTMMSFILRGKMHENARLVLLGPNPHDMYNASHLQTFEHVLTTMEALEEVNHVINFLRSPADIKHSVVDAVCDQGATASDLAHERMYQCLDVPVVLGIIECEASKRFERV